VTLTLICIDDQGMAVAVEGLQAYRLEHPDYRPVAVAQDDRVYRPGERSHRVYYGAQGQLTQTHFKSWLELAAYLRAWKAERHPERAK